MLLLQDSISFYSPLEWPAAPVQCVDDLSSGHLQLSTQIASVWPQLCLLIYKTAFVRFNFLCKEKIVKFLLRNFKYFGFKSNVLLFVVDLGYYFVVFIFYPSFPAKFFSLYF